MKSIPIVFIAIPLLINIVSIPKNNLIFNILRNWSIRYAYKYVLSNNYVCLISFIKLL